MLVSAKISKRGNDLVSTAVVRASQLGVDTAFKTAKPRQDVEARSSVGALRGHLARLEHVAREARVVIDAFVEGNPVIIDRRIDDLDMALHEIGAKR